MAIRIRRLTRRDLPRVLEIDQESYDLPWDESEFSWYMWQRYLWGRQCFGRVLEERGLIVAYAVYLRLPRGRVEMLRLATDPERRREGFALRLLASIPGADQIRFTVSDRDLEAHLWLRHLGFRATRIVRDSRGDRYRFVLGSDAVPVQNGKIRDGS